MSKRKSPTTWTKDECHKEALKYNKRTDFRDNCASAYKFCQRRGWLDEVCSHINTKKVKPSGYWTKEKCLQEALKYEERGQFQKQSRNAYYKAWKNNWLDEICSHMESHGCLKNRYIYAFEFKELKSVYIGLSWNIDKREKQHLNDESTTVNKFITEHNLTTEDYELKELGYYPAEHASEKEGEFEQQYRDTNWTILNQAPTGNLGNNKIKWTKEMLHEEALKYKTRGEFKKGSYNAYHVVVCRKLMDELCTHMKLPKYLRRNL